MILLQLGPSGGPLVVAVPPDLEVLHQNRKR